MTGAFPWSALVVGKSSPARRGMPSLFQILPASCPGARPSGLGRGYERHGGSEAG
jgi:hypothetical protein